MKVSFKGYAQETMSVGDLKAAIAGFADDMPVLGSWEGITPSLHSAKTETRDGITVLLLDVDNE